MSRPARTRYIPPGSVKVADKRSDAVRRYFKARQDALEAKAKHAAEGHTLQVGDILSSSWGYEQTNVDFYEVVAVSKCMVTLHELAQVSTETDWARGRCIPQSGKYKGEPFRRKADKHGVMIESYEFASKWGARGPGGIVIGKAESWTAYH